jgi:hypothetical protein
VLPGAGLSAGGTGSLLILNAGLDEDTVLVTALNDQPASQEIAVPAGMVVEVPAMAGPANAYTVEGQGQLVAAWVATGEGATAYSIGVSQTDE